MAFAIYIRCREIEKRAEIASKQAKQQAYNKENKPNLVHT